MSQHDIEKQTEISNENNTCQAHIPTQNLTDDETFKQNEETNAWTDSFGQDMLSQSVREAGRLAFGTVAAELWIYYPPTGKLHRPDGGWWNSSYYDVTDDVMESIGRLTDQTRVDYVPPLPLAPGVGLAGALWSEMDIPEGGECAIEGDVRSAPLPLSLSLRGSRRRLKVQRRVMWREVRAVAEDPFQPPNERLQVLKDAGFGLAAGAPFEVGNTGNRGIVVYMVSPLADRRKLKSIVNENYLCSAADLIGAVYHMRASRRERLMEYKDELDDKWRRAMLKLKAVHWIRNYQHDQYEGGKLKYDIPSQNGKCFGHKIQHEDSLPSQSNPSTPSFSEYLLMYRKKCHGAHIQPPPPMPPNQLVFTTFAVFITNLILSQINLLVTTVTNNQTTLVLGPLVAFSTLTFSLTAAPASQPRNAIFGQIIGTTVGMSLSRLDDYSVPTWVKTTLSPTITIPLMSGLGVVHPPAAASCIIFLSGKYDWYDVALFWACVCLVVVISTLVNNLSWKRQYPTTWVMLEPWWVMFISFFGFRTK